MWPGRAFAFTASILAGISSPKWHYQVINVRSNNRFPDNKPKLQMNGGLKLSSPARRHVAVNDLAVTYSSPN